MRRKQVAWSFLFLYVLVIQVWPASGFCCEAACGALLQKDNCTRSDPNAVCKVEDYGECRCIWIATTEQRTRKQCLAEKLLPRGSGIEISTSVIIIVAPIIGCCCCCCMGCYWVFRWLGKGEAEEHDDSDDEDEEAGQVQLRKKKARATDIAKRGMARARRISQAVLGDALANMMQDRNSEEDVMDMGPRSSRRRPGKRGSIMADPRTSNFKGTVDDLEEHEEHGHKRWWNRGRRQSQQSSNGRERRRSSLWFGSADGSVGRRRSSLEGSDLEIARSASAERQTSHNEHHHGHGRRRRRSSVGSHGSFGSGEGSHHAHRRHSKTGEEMVHELLTGPRAPGGGRRKSYVADHHGRKPRLSLISHGKFIGDVDEDPLFDQAARARSEEEPEEHVVVDPSKPYEVVHEGDEVDNKGVIHHHLPAPPKADSPSASPPPSVMASKGQRGRRSGLLSVDGGGAAEQGGQRQGSQPPANLLGKEQSSAVPYEVVHEGDQVDDQGVIHHHLPGPPKAEDSPALVVPPASKGRRGRRSGLLSVDVPAEPQFSEAKAAPSVTQQGTEPHAGLPLDSEAAAKLAAESAELRSDLVVIGQTSSPRFLVSGDDNKLAPLLPRKGSARQTAQLISTDAIPPPAVTAASADDCGSQRGEPVTRTEVDRGGRQTLTMPPPRGRPRNPHAPPRLQRLVDHRPASTQLKPDQAAQGAVQATSDAQVQAPKPSRDARKEDSHTSIAKRILLWT